jgi:Ca-activated chloride channel family protein
MKQWIAILVFVVPAIGSRAQNKQEQALLYKANQLYQSGRYNEAEQWYDKVLELNPNNSIALFNKANALQQQKNYEAAAKQFEQAAAVTNDNDLKAKAYYNSGVAAIKQQQLANAINAWKQSLLLNPNSDSARNNLQKALNEQKKQQQNNQQNKPQPKNPLNKQQADNLLNQLRQQEKELQQYEKQKLKPVNTEKDW